MGGSLSHGMMSLQRRLMKKFVKAKDDSLNCVIQKMKFVICHPQCEQYTYSFMFHRYVQLVVFRSTRAKSLTFCST
jgi:hypothetical protein